MITPSGQLTAAATASPSELGQAAREYARRGWHVFPLRSGRKDPLIGGGFRVATCDPGTVDEWWSTRPYANIGLAPAPSGLIVFDIDSPEAQAIATSLGLLELETLEVQTGRESFPGRHLYFAYTDGPTGNFRIGYRKGLLARVDGKTPALELKADGGYVVAPPSVHPNGKIYAFKNPQCLPAELPQRAKEAIAGLIAPTAQASKGQPGTSRGRYAARDPEIKLADCERWVDQLLGFRCEAYDDWVKVLMAIHHQFAGTLDEPAALALLERWSQKSGKYRPGDVRDKWNSFIADASGKGVTIRSLRHWAEEDSGHREGYPTVDCTTPSESLLTAPTWKAIARRNGEEPQTFLSAAGLCGLRPRMDGTLFIAPFVPETLAQHLAERVADFRRTTRAGSKPCYPPRELLQHLLANPQPPVDLPRLERVVPVPIFAANGELITAPGYHKASRTYYAPAPSLPPLRPVSDRPNDVELLAAIRIFDEHIGSNFPFAADNGASRAHALTLALQGFVMDVIDDVAPLFDIEAAQPRCGKGLLAECCLMGAFGPALATKRTPMPNSDEEMNKVLTALFRDGGLLIAFDNVRSAIDFPAFEAALTAGVFEGRVLGSSSLIRARNRATWVMISNNPEMSGDLAGRAIRIRLVSPVEFPEDRTDFARIQPAHTRSRLPELIWSLQTIVRNWFAVGCPGPGVETPGLGSYARWREVMGGILHAADIPGFLANRNDLRSNAPRKNLNWRDFICEWQQSRGTEPVALNELVELAERHSVELAGDTPRAKATALGMRLGKSIGVRYFDQFTVEKVKRGGERFWQLQDHGAVSLFPAVCEGGTKHVVS